VLTLNLKSGLSKSPFLNHVIVGSGVPVILHLSFMLLPSDIVKEGFKSETFGGLAEKQSRLKESFF